ncbi:MAG: hypothetical protein JWQ11_96 [Rhizobacter sp.]|nr:hypothetical protein [Rhizobacter sp.]
MASHLTGAHGIRQVGRFHLGGPFTGNPEFLMTTQAGRVLDPERILVTTDLDGGAILSIDASASELAVPSRLSGWRAGPGAALQVYSANTPAYSNRLHNGSARTADAPAVASPRYLSINNAFGRPWIANAPHALNDEGTVSVTDPNGAPLANAPSDTAGGVFAGERTSRTSVATSSRTGWLASWLDRRQSGQLTPGALAAGAYGTALLGTSPDNTGFAVFAAVTGTGAVVQVHVQDGVDGLAPPGTIDIGPADPGVVGMAFAWAPRRGLFVAEARHDRIAVLHLRDDGHQFLLDGIDHIASPWLRSPIDLAPAIPEIANPRFASHTTLAGGADLYVANAGDGSLLRIGQDGSVVARATIRDTAGRTVGSGELKSIAVSADAQRLWVVVRSPGRPGDDLLELQAFDARGPYTAAGATEARAVVTSPDGDALLHQVFTAQTGLGRTFNADSCAACHDGGRGASGREEHFARRIARLDARSGRIMPMEGTDSAMAPRRSLDVAGTLPLPRAANVVSLRMPLALLAAARIDEVDDAAIEAQAVAKGDGVHGRVHRLPSADGGQRIGRYGWKADVATLDEMVGVALSDEMGLTSALSPRARPPFRDDGTLARAMAASLRAPPVDAAANPLASERAR